jgi:uncharacterized protein YjiS (DUF1127 family)
MTAIRRRKELVKPAVLTPHASALLKRCWTALQERRKRARLRATLYALPDRALRDIGVSWSEIEHLALNGTDERVDPRGRQQDALPECLHLALTARSARCGDSGS